MRNTSSARMAAYVPLVQQFAARVVLFHTAVADRLGLHATDLKSLRLLGEEPLSAGDLGRRVGLSGPAVTALVDRLEAAGYVVRERDGDDRRRVTVRAVAAKVRQVDRLYDGQGARMAKLLSTYSDAEFAAITDFLGRTTRVLTEAADELR